MKILLDTIQLEIDKECLKYIDDLNRGGLLYPSNILFKVIQIVYDIFNLCVSKYEINFTKCTYEKNVILAISIEYISKNDDELMEIYEICTYCHSDNYSMIKKGLSVFINILLKNYRKLKSDVNKKIYINFLNINIIVIILLYIIFTIKFKLL